MLKNSAYAGIFLLVTGLSIFMLIRFTLFSGGLSAEGELRLPGLQQQVQLERLESGRAAISATTTADGFYALGFVHAQDRLWQLQRFKWAADSRWASVFGDAFLPADRLTAALLHPLHRQPEDALAQLSSSQKAAIRDYTAGINAYIDKTGRHYPLQFTLSNTQPERWQPADVLRVFALQLWLFQSEWQQDMAYAAIIGQLPDQLLPFLFDTAEISRLRKLSPETAGLERNAVFKLLMADHQLRINLNAPQQLPAIRTLVSEERGFRLTALQSGPQAFGFWYDVSLSIEAPGERRQFSGFTLPGAPLFWAATNEAGQVWTAQHSFASADIITADPADRAGAGRNLTHADESMTAFRFSSAYAPETDEGAFLLDDTASGSMFRRPALVTGFTSFFEHKMQRALVDEHSQAQPASDTLPAGGFRLAALPPAEDALTASALALAPRSDAERLDERLPDIIDRAFFEQQVNSSRMNLANELAGLIEPFISEPDLALSYEYLSNWDGRYDRHAVAASIIEGSLLESSRRALQPYVDEADFEQIYALGLINSQLGRTLIKAHIETMQTGRSSAVDDAFFARRVRDAIKQLRRELGEEAYTWRWANRYRFQYTDEALCSVESAVAESAGPAGLARGRFSGRRSGCRQIVLDNPYPVSGQKQLINAALGYDTPAGFKVATITTGFMQKEDVSGSGLVRLLQLPGYAVHPFSPYYGGNIAPDLQELRVETRPAGQDHTGRRVLILHPE